MAKDLKKAYRTMAGDQWPPRMQIEFFGDIGNHWPRLIYEKVNWLVQGDVKGLRYGDNPDQEAAFYRLVNGNLVLGKTQMILPGKYLMSDMDLLQSGKHPGKTNLTDADSALNILRYFTDKPTAVIVKHNNPCGVARAGTLVEAYQRANMADRVAAFGGCIALNQPVDNATARAIVEQYAEVVVAPGYEEASIGILGQKKDLRVIKVEAMKNLQDFVGERVVEFKALIDGGLIAQWSFVPKTMTKEDLLPAECEHEGQTYRINRAPTEAEYRDMLFGWLVETGVTSNSVIYVQDECTVGIGTGEQDRVGVAEIARDKAYRKMADRICWELYGEPYNSLRDPDTKADIDAKVTTEKGGLPGSVMVSDAFFPFRDGVDVGLDEGVTAVIQPGGSNRDFESIEACNERGAIMAFTGQRCFRH